MKIIREKIALAELSANQDNPRTISKVEFEKLKKSLQEFPEMKGIRPIVIDEDNIVLGGNMRLAAMRALGQTEAEVVRVTGLTDAQKKEFVVKDNLPYGDWDWDKLANEWDEKDLVKWGLRKPTKDIVEDVAPNPEMAEPKSRLGAIYELGPHRVFCGSFEDDGAVDKMFGNLKAACAFTDPPYNVNYKGTAGPIQNDNMSDEDFVAFLQSALESIKLHSDDGAGAIIWTADTSIPQVLAAEAAAAMQFRELIVWVKDGFTLGHSDLQYATEPAIYCVAEGTAPAKTPAGNELDAEIAIYTRGAHGTFQQDRARQNVWYFQKPRKNKAHPTMKPIGLCVKGILMLSHDGDIVYDPFLGSGSTLIAAEQTGRACYGCEIEPKFVDVIRRRWATLVNGDEDGWEEATPEVEA